MSKFTQDIILTPVVTERSMDIMRSQRKYTFKVAKDANKIEIAKAVEEIFKVKVAKVRTITVPSKNKRVGVHEGKTAKRKKAIVTLTPASKTIEFFDSMQ